MPWKQKNKEKKMPVALKKTPDILKSGKNKNRQAVWRLALETGMNVKRAVKAAENADIIVLNSLWQRCGFGENTNRLLFLTGGALKSYDLDLKRLKPKMC